MNNLFDLHTLLEKEEPWPFFISRVNGVKPRFSMLFCATFGQERGCLSCLIWIR